MAASTTIANITDGNNSVDITFIKLEHDFDKQVTNISVPKSTDANNTCPISTSVKNPLGLNIDLLKLKQVITITGWILAEANSSELEKMDKLEVIVSGGSGNKAKLLTLTWKIQSDSLITITKKGTILKYKLTEIAGRVGNPGYCTVAGYTDKTACEGGGGTWITSQTKAFMINLQFIVGQVKG